MESKDLKNKYSELWKKNLNHPFLKEIENNKLPIENFQFYLKQDYLYLLDYSKALGLLIAKSETEEKIREYTKILNKTINIEIQHHKTYSKKIGIQNQLKKAEKTPTTAAYTNYLLRTAYENSIPEIISVILPCFWIYMDLGKKLNPNNTRKEYKEWIKTYQTEEFKELINKLKSDLNHYLKNSSQNRIRKINKKFKRSLQYEYKFWEMSYNKEKWID